MFHVRSKVWGLPAAGLVAPVALIGLSLTAATVGAQAPGARFRLYLYDDFTKPLPADQASDVKARVVTEETFDPRTRTATEVTSFPLALSSEGAFMDAAVGTLTMPATMTVKAVFEPGPAAATPTPASPGAWRAPRPALVPQPHVVRAAYHPGAPRLAALRAFQAPALTNTAPPPETAAGIMEVLATHNKELKDFVDRGVFNEVWVPALASKDVAVYLDDHLEELAPEQREPAQAAVARLVRACWLLDAVGDLGNRPQVVDAYTKYTEALTDVQTFFPGK